MSKKQVVSRHILVWLIFIGYELAFLYFSVGWRASFFQFFIYYGLNIALFYTTSEGILNTAFFKTRKPYLFTFFVIIFELICYLAVKYLFDLGFSKSPVPHTDWMHHINLYIVTNIWRAVYFIGLSIAYWSMQSFIRYKEKNHRIETAQLKTIAENLELENKYMAVENAYLHNQISPHLLFNSLNIIYQAVKPKSPEAGDSVARLAELMRYSLAGSDDGRTVLLRDEMKQIDNLVELCRMRFGKEFFFRFNKKGKLQDVEIIPMILITLVENMMKHGDLGLKKYPGRVMLEYSGNLLRFETFNKKRDFDLYPKGGLGLKNIEKRLHNYYQDRYTLHTAVKDGFFTVNLTIVL
jgi:two-component system, LytTR family, sensor kinase